MELSVDADGHVIESRVCLFVSFYRQYREWPYVIKSLENQTKQPDHIIVGIDDSRMQPPDFGGLPVTVIRSPEQHDGQFSKGCLINKAARITHCNVMLTLDGDSMLSPRSVKIAAAIYSGQLREWSYTTRAGKKHLLRTANPWSNLFVGSRFYVSDEIFTCDPICLNWPTVSGLTIFDPSQNRGFDNGLAAYQSGISIFPVAAQQYVSRPEVGRGEDAKWWIQAKERFACKPAPNQFYSVHIGTRHQGDRGLGKRDLEYLRAAEANERPRQWYRPYLGYKEGVPMLLGDR